MTSLPFHLRAAIAGAVTSLCAILLIAFFILIPRHPEFRVDSASTISLNFTGPKLTAGWDITLLVSNPNYELVVSSDAVSVGVFYGDDDNHTTYVLLASTDLPSFYFSLGAGCKITRRSQFEVVVDNGVANSIAVIRHGNGILVNFRVVFSAFIRFHGTFHPRKVHLLKLVCYPLSSQLSYNVNNNNITGVLLRGLNCF